MSLQTQLFEICDLAFLSRENKLSVVGIFDQIFSDRLPFNYLKFCLVAVISGPPESSHRIDLAIFDPAGQPLIPAQSLNLTLGPNGKANFVSDVGNLQFKLSGTHTIELRLGRKAFASKQFQVTKVSQPEPSSSIN